MAEIKINVQKSNPDNNPDNTLNKKSLVSKVIETTRAATGVAALSIALGSTPNATASDIVLPPKQEQVVPSLKARLGDEGYKEYTKSVETELQELISEDIFDYTFDDVIPDIRNAGLEQELIETIESISSEIYKLPDSFKTEYYYGIMMGITLKANPVKYGLDVKFIRDNYLNKFISDGAIQIDQNKKYAKLINFFRKNGDKIFELSQLNLNQLQSETAKIKKENIEKDKTLAEKDKTLAEKDKTLAEKDKTLAEKDKKLKILKEFLNLLEKNS